ncbi:hypothetical protein GQ457_11G033330 [Hibiscus cannabinus]
MKVFNANLLKFLPSFQFPSVARFFAQPPSTTPPQPNILAATQPSATTSAKAGATEEVNFSSDDENDIFDWQSPRDQLQPLGLTTTTTPAPAVPILSAAPTPATSAVAERPTPDSPTRRKGKETAGKTFDREIPSSPKDEADHAQPREGGSTMLSMLIVVTMIAVLKFQFPNPCNLPIHLFLLLFNLLICHLSLTLVFLPCIEDNASLEFGGALV